MSGKYERNNRMEERKSGIEEGETGGSFFGKQKFCTGQECRKVESACSINAGDTCIAIDTLASIFHHET